MPKRVILIVLDSVGIGAAADAAAYGDSGANTLGHLAEQYPRLTLPNLELLGLGLLKGPGRFNVPETVIGDAARLEPQAAGKDTTTGHWEIAGCILHEPFPTYPDGFPADLIHQFESLIGRRILGNCVASGTQIIRQLGRQHMETGRPIVYTSADSVFQIAAHESIIPPDQLYTICRQARKLLVPPHAVGRVIARPFTGDEPNWQRTARRRDFSLEPICPTLLDQVKDSGREVLAVGKISDIFAGRGVSQSWKTTDNQAGIEQTIKLMKKEFDGLLMVNLVDFDMLYGHRNDIAGYAKALMAFDRQLPRIIEQTGPQDLLMITADHGCDPSFPGTDHTREAVPLILYSPEKTSGRYHETLPGFHHIAATAAAWLGLRQDGIDLLKLTSDD